MGHLIRVAFVCCVFAAVFLIFGVGYAGNNTALMGPAHLLLFLIGCAVYLLPTALAMYRNCKSLTGIALVNIFLGWTVLGWFAALGWAASGMPGGLAPAGHPVPRHT